MLRSSLHAPFFSPTSNITPLLAASALLHSSPRFSFLVDKRRYDLGFGEGRGQVSLPLRWRHVVEWVKIEDGLLSGPPDRLPRFCDGVRPPSTDIHCFGFIRLARPRAGPKTSSLPERSVQGLRGFTPHDTPTRWSQPATVAMPRPQAGKRGQEEAHHPLNPLGLSSLLQVHLANSCSIFHLHTGPTPTTTTTVVSFQHGLHILPTPRFYDLDPSPYAPQDPPHRLE
jgi:hypothetical protein